MVWRLLQVELDTHIWKLYVAEIHSYQLEKWLCLNGTESLSHQQETEGWNVSLIKFRYQSANTTNTNIVLSLQLENKYLDSCDNSLT